MGNALAPKKNAMNTEEVLSYTGENTDEGRPIFKNQHGEYVTERTITEYVEPLGGYVNIPTVLDGRFLTREEAIDTAIKTGGADIITGRRLDVFNDVNKAVEAAQKRSIHLGIKLKPKAK